jgi:hypothetical protein
LTVQASWLDLSANGTQISQKLRTLSVSTDSVGNFALCGLPAETGLSIRASGDSAESGRFDVPPLGGERILRRDLTIGLPLASAVAAGRGASIGGRVVGDSGRGPIENAELSLADLGLVTTTNDRGQYDFKDLVAGSHHIHVRKIGYAEVDLVVDLDEADRVTRDIALTRVTLLDSMAVVGRVLPRDEAMRSFEEHRRTGLGKFLTPDDLVKAQNTHLTSLIQQWPGLYVPGRRGSWPQSTRGAKSLRGGCQMAVYLDGIRLDPNDGDLDSVAPPERLAAVEYYPGPSSVPPEYARLNTQCGVIVLHSRYKTGK